MTAMDVLSLNAVTTLVINSTDKALQTTKDRVHRDQNLVVLVKKASNLKALLLSLRDKLESSKDTDPWLMGFAHCIRQMDQWNDIELYWKHPPRDWNLTFCKIKPKNERNSLGSR